MARSPQSDKSERQTRWYKDRPRKGEVSAHWPFRLPNGWRVSGERVRAKRAARVRWTRVFGDRLISETLATANRLREWQRPTWG